jgi:TonB-dependent SusC/RagA subfamily outer membrane receptor
MKWNKALAMVIALCLTQFVFGQDAAKKSDKLITITGKVKNQDKKPVADAVFSVDNIKTNIVTKSNGSYKIRVSPSAVYLEVFSPEYGVGSATINGQTKIDFTLNNPVTATVKTADSTKFGMAGKTNKASSKPRGRKMNTYNNIYQMIREEVPGVTVNGRNITIQQAHSFFGSSTPLFVVNGVIVQSIDNINPVEVKSIGLLKGASAAIYGVNGSNGVISITLKNGTEKEQ